MEKLPSLLAINYFFPPIKSVAVLRNAFFIKNCLPFLSKAHVITTANQRILPNDVFEIADEKLTVFVAQTVDYRTLTTKKTAKGTMHFDEKTKENWFAQFIIKLNKSFPFNLLLGEGGLIYIIQAYWHARKLMKTERFDWIYSSYMPHSDHFVAYLLKKKDPSVIWIADYRDLHVEPVYKNVFWENFQHWCNRQLLKQADLVTTVSEGLAKHLRAYHSNVYVFQNGIAEIAAELPPQYADKFTIAYTGSMFLDERNPRLLLKVVKDLVDENILNSDNFQIVYAGKDTAIWQNWVDKFDLSDCFISKGLVAHADAKNLQQRAHINLLLTTATAEWTGVMTGKIYEYLAAQNPILVLINGSQDIEIESFITNFNAGLVAYNDRSEATVRQFILEKLGQFQTAKSVERTIKKDQLKSLSWAATVEKLVEKIKTL